MQGNTRQPKRRRAAQTKHVRSKVRLTKVRQETNRRQREEGRAAKQESKKQQKELEEYECTCHVYGQTHKYRESLAQKIHLGEWGNSAPVTSMDRYASENDDPSEQNK